MTKTKRISKPTKKTKKTGWSSAILLLIKNWKIQNRKQTTNLVQLLWKEEQVERSKLSTFSEVKTFALFIFEDIKKKNAKMYKPATFFRRIIRRYVNTKDTTANLLNEDEFKLSG